MKEFSCYCFELSALKRYIFSPLKHIQLLPPDFGIIIKRNPFSVVVPLLTSCSVQIHLSIVNEKPFPSSALLGLYLNQYKDAQINLFLNESYTSKLLLKRLQYPRVQVVLQLSDSKTLNQT
jgi:hypothetical protein